MWSRIAEEMAIPWRAAEAMHWQMGEHEMARRAGVTPFTLANTANNMHQPTHHRPLARSNSSHGMSPRLRRNSGPAGEPLVLPSLSELTAGLPAFAPPPSGFTSQPTTPYEFPTRRSLPPSLMYEQHHSPPPGHHPPLPGYQPNGRRFP
jgi:hypothetical protein